MKSKACFNSHGWGCKSQMGGAKGQGLPGRKMLPPCTKLVYTSLELKEHCFEEVILLSELKEKPVWLFFILPEL